MREAGFIDGQVLKLVHLSADSNDDGDGGTSHVTCHAAQLNPDVAAPLQVPTAPSYAVASILFQLQGGGRAAALALGRLTMFAGLTLSPAAHALLLLLGVYMPTVTCDV